MISRLFFQQLLSNPQEIFSNPPQPFHAQKAAKTLGSIVRTSTVKTLLLYIYNLLYYQSMVNIHPKEETTVLIIKPDGVKRGLVGEIIKRVESRGLKIIALNMIWATPEQIDIHYPKNEEWIRRLGEKTLASYEKYGYDAQKELGTTDPLEIGKKVRSWLVDFMTSGPLVKMVVKGVHAIDMVRKLCGPTVPAQAEMGTIRGDFSVDSAAAANRDRRAIHNLVHASETPQEAEHELKLWFLPEEIHDYKRAEEEIAF